MTVRDARWVSTVVARLLLILSTGLGACGGDDPLDPVQGCRDFIDVWCNKQIECAVPTDRTRVGEDCHFASDLNIDCSKVKGLGASYGVCLHDVQAVACGTDSGAQRLDNLSSCKGILLL
jgi:hypothetical protein